MFNEITSDNKETLIAWAEEKLGVTFRDDAKAIARMDDGVIRAVCVFDTFTECDCNIHIASDLSKRAVSFKMLIEVFYYAFVTADLRRVTGLVDSKNQQAINYDKKLGFVVEGYSRNTTPNGDTVILGMLRCYCRWISSEHRRS